MKIHTQMRKLYLFLCEAARISQTTLLYLFTSKTIAFSRIMMIIEIIHIKSQLMHIVFVIYFMNLISSELYI